MPVYTTASIYQMNYEYQMKYYNLIVIVFLQYVIIDSQGTVSRFIGFIN